MAAVVGGLAAAGLGVFLIVRGVNDADKVLGFVVSVLGLAVSVYSAVLTRRSLQGIEAGSSGADGVNSTIGGGVSSVIRGGTFYGPVVQGRDMSGLTFGTSTPPGGTSGAATPPTQGGAV